MSEYQERHTVARLVGVPPGYVGDEEGGQLTQAVRRRPYSLVLLDEIEKAHAEVFDVLLRSSTRPPHGRPRPPSTSEHRGDHDLQPPHGGRHARGLPAGVPHRIDEIVEFQPLSREQLGEIVELQLARLRARLAERGLGLELTDAAKEHVAEAGWDPTYGARPLKRALQRLVENPLALRLLEGEFAEGDMIRVDAPTASWPSPRRRQQRPPPS